MHINEFLQVGGDSEWLSGLEYIPQKLKNLNEVNKILAHRPWLITKEHIKVTKIDILQLFIDHSSLWTFAHVSLLFCVTALLETQKLFISERSMKNIDC